MEHDYKQSNNIHKKSEANFFDIFNIRFEAGTDVKEFYHEYRNTIIVNLKRCGDIILWQNARALDEDEEISPTFEDLIFANVLGLIDCDLLEHVRDNYSLKVDGKKCLMDYKEDILDMVSALLSQNGATLLEDLGR